MSCYHPSKVTISRKSLAGLRFRVADRVVVPCGHCLGCRTDQARGWAVRLVHEGMVNSPSWMATFTYKEEELPVNGSLFPRDFTLFVKKFRAAQSKLERPLSYYVSGEYGDDTHRPHYHAILFGPQFLDREFMLMRHGAPVYYSQSLEETWSHGRVEVTGLTYAGARYVASYVRKKVRQRDDPEHYARVDPATGELVELEREFGRMSRRPAIGHDWLKRYWSDVYPRDFVVMDGKPLKPPRYYDKKMEEWQPAIMMAVKEQRLKDIIDFSEDDLIMKEKCHRARVNLFQGRAGV